MERSALPDLNTFLVVAERLSFRATAAQLGLTSPAVSHSIRQLEEKLGVRLLNRTTRSVSLTEAGVHLRDRLRPAFNEISGALAELNEERQRTSGHLRIRASPLAANVALAPMWQRFMCTYPEVHLELRVDVGPADIVASGFDAGIGPKDWVSADMIAVRVTGPVKLVVVGAPSYFAIRRPPRTPDDLASHDCIQYRFGANDALVRWPLARSGRTRPMAVAGRLIVNSPDLVLRAAVDGLGLAFTAEGSAAPYLRSGQLVQVLEGRLPTMEGLFLYYHGHRQVPTALRAFIDMIRTPKSASARRSIKSPF
jgi:DNA-binding transcriptional LysR family regulator